MKIVRTALLLVAGIWLVATPALAAPDTEAHVADRATLERTLAAHADAAEADREAIRRVLEYQEVQEVAQRFGIDLSRAQAALGLLDGDELGQIAEQARAVDSSLAGGQSRVVISTTAIIIILLLLILIIVAVN